MGILTDDMKRVVREQRLAFVATVCPDHTPNLSPKGTTAVWDDDHLVFANIRSPRTISNLRHNPAIEINVVDPIVRKGYRFKGTATIVESDERFDNIMASVYEGMSEPIRDRVQRLVLVRVERAQPLISPAYDAGATEPEVRAGWEEYWREVRGGGADG
jgi:predicted pyridoxine 5'-phosphate oxidase superfamily flavin-nucleotide-binding protein